MPVRKARNSDNKDWPMIVGEVDQALYDYRDGVATVEQLGDALLALAEHNHIHLTYVYGR
jgi:hypothetical protein